MWGSIGLSWLVCNKIMLKYWIFHGLNYLLPEMDPWEGLLGDLGLSEDALSTGAVNCHRHILLKLSIIVLLIFIINKI